MEHHRGEHPRTDRDHRYRRLTSSGDRGVGTFGTAAGFVVFLLFLLLSVQLLYGLHARTTISAIGTDVAADSARRAADGWTAADRDAATAEVRQRLGELGRSAQVDTRLVDDDADGVPDAVTVTIRAELPRFLPVRWSGTGTTVERTARARLEHFLGASP